MNALHECLRMPGSIGIHIFIWNHHINIFIKSIQQLPMKQKHIQTAPSRNYLAVRNQSTGNAELKGPIRTFVPL